MSFGVFERSHRRRQPFAEQVFNPLEIAVTLGPYPLQQQPYLVGVHAFDIGQIELGRAHDPLEALVGEPTKLAETLE